ncbi:hypothetical protein [Actinoplanes sp. NPDC049802]|uniref:hypothetical protein n=1 Tax=Actinoplanes sp. NPDC049802 TaxID=3154742 RepID=UPI0033E7A94F
MKRPVLRLARWWLYSGLSVDIWLAFAIAGVTACSYLVHTDLGASLSASLLAEASWPTYMQTLSGVCAALLGFGATSFTLLLAVGTGRRGKFALQSVGRGLGEMLARCLGSLIFVALLFAVSGGLRPSLCIPAFGAGLAAAVVLMTLRISRLWYLLVRILRLYLIDVSD